MHRATTITYGFYWAWALVFFCALFGWATDVQADTAGKFLFVRGQVWIVDAAGKRHEAKRGDAVTEGDTVETGKDGYAQLVMEDQGFMAIRPNTTLRIDTFQYKGQADGTEKGAFSLMKGGFRAITGAIGRKNKKNYQIKTPVANIGIRGTDHEPMFIPVPAPGEMAVGEPGVYDKVNVGEAYIENDAGMVAIGENEVGFTPDAATVPDTLAEMPGFYRESPVPSQAPEEETESEPSDSSGENDAQDTDEEEAEGQEQTQEDESDETEAASGEEDQEEGQPQETSSDESEPSPASDNSEEDGTDGQISVSSGSTDSADTQTEGDASLASGDGGMDDGFSDAIADDALGTTSDETIIEQPITSQDGAVDLMNPDTVELAPYRIVGFATWDPRSPSPPHSLENGSANKTAELTYDISGNLIGFEGEIPVIGGAPDNWDYVNLDMNSDYTVTDTGSMTLDSGGEVIWGRWHSSLTTPQNIATYSDTGAAVSPAFYPQDVHYVAGPEMTNPVLLPISGTVSYTLVDNTTPTTDMGITGTLNSAYLTAHFDQMTVDVGVNVSAPANITLDASASGIPIDAVGAGSTLQEQGPGFGAGALESSPLTVTCSGIGCGTTHDGTVAGGFIGQSGEAAAVGYSLNTTNNSTIDTNVMGIVVFKK